MVLITRARELVTIAHAGTGTMPVICRARYGAWGGHGRPCDPMRETRRPLEELCNPLRVPLDIRVNSRDEWSNRGGSDGSGEDSCGQWLGSEPTPGLII